MHLVGDKTERSGLWSQEGIIKQTDVKEPAQSMPHSKWAGFACCQIILFNLVATEIDAENRKKTVGLENQHKCLDRTITRVATSSRVCPPALEKE